MNHRREFSEHLHALLADMGRDQRDEFLADCAEEIANQRQEHEPDCFAASRESRILQEL